MKRYDLMYEEGSSDGFMGESSDGEYGLIKEFDEILAEYNAEILRLNEKITLIYVEVGVRLAGQVLLNSLIKPEEVKEDETTS